MKSLIVVDLTPKNKDMMAQYSALAAQTLAPFNGRFIAKGQTVALNGEANYSIKAVIEFPDTESAKAWYSSDAYQSIIPLREQAMQSQFHLV